MLEPRVMQVLVALHDAEGTVLSRDQLVALCWNSRVIGDDAVYRTIAAVRRAVRSVAPDAFAIETIPKTGFRLAAARASPDAVPMVDGPVPASSPISRRALIGAGLATATGGGVAWLLSGSEDKYPSVAASSLFDKAIEDERLGGQGAGIRAIAYLEEAVRLDPEWGAAWGALALAYRNSIDSAEETHKEELARGVKAAARRAQSLEHGNVDAYAAVILTPPFFRNWRSIETRCREALRQHPDHWQLRFNLGQILCHVGRWQDGLEQYEYLLPSDPTLLTVRRKLATALWGAGRVDEAEEETRTALKHWPEDPEFWLARFNFLTLTGRADTALDMLAVEKANPLDSPLPSDIAAPTARALLTRSAGDVQQAIEVHLVGREQERVATVQSVPYLAAMGAVDAAFGMLDRYFSGPKRPTGGRQALPRMADRATGFLFLPGTAPLREDARFADLTQAIGLDDYWRGTWSVPDWKR